MGKKCKIILRLSHRMLGIVEKLKRAMKLPGYHCVRKINSSLKDESGSHLPQDGGCGESLNRFYSLVQGIEEGRAASKSPH